jgi:pyruvate dehydrogenase E2 component (dihydrolipoamide acetyltransferase)
MTTQSNSQDAFGPVATLPLSRSQKFVAKRLSHNAATIPHVTHNDEVDISDVDAARASLASNAKITMLIFIIKGVVEALKAYPHFNASLAEDGETLILKQYFNIGVAVDTAAGLLVPVIRNCDSKSLTDIAEELADTDQFAWRNRRDILLANHKCPRSGDPRCNEKPDKADLGWLGFCAPPNVAAFVEL